MKHGFSISDSQKRHGGRIPGTRGLPAFWFWQGRPSPVPVLIAVPHAGRIYPAPVLRSLRDPGRAVLKLEDRHVDRVAHQLAAATGAAILVAQAPRAMIDLNRAPDDLDWEMMDRAERVDLPAGRPGGRARNGLGLVPRRVPGIGELWQSRLSASDLDQRIADIHAPYHEALAGILADLRARWGAALLIDLHSMPPLDQRGPDGAPELVIGDRFGASCDGRLAAEAFACLGAVGRRAAHNRPYAGGYVLERHGQPAGGFHAMQIEIDRSTYLDPAFAELGAGLQSTVDALGTLVRRLAAVVADLGEQRRATTWPQAAE